MEDGVNGGQGGWRTGWIEGRVDGAREGGGGHARVVDDGDRIPVGMHTGTTPHVRFFARSPALLYCPLTCVDLHMSA